MVRAVELVYAVEEARGTLFHRYQLAGDGTIVSARIVPPTAQNQDSVEGDVRQLVATRLDLDLTVERK